MDKDLKDLLELIIDKIDNQSQQLGEINKRLDRHDERFTRIDERFTQIDERFAQIDERFAQIDERFAQIDERFAQIDEKINDLTKITVNLENTIVRRLDALADGYALTYERQQELGHRVDELERRVEVVEIKTA